MVETAPDLYRRIKTENEKNVKAQKKQLDKLKFPPQVVTAAQLNQLSAKGQYLTLDEKEVFFQERSTTRRKTFLGLASCCRRRQRQKEQRQKEQQTTKRCTSHCPSEKRKSSKGWE